MLRGFRYHDQDPYKSVRFIGYIQKKNLYLPSISIITMLIIEPRRGETIDRMLRRYKKKVDKTKLTKRVRNRLHFIKGSTLRRKEILKAVLKERYQRLYL